jgi:Leucine-rich repeat (LRR) protein
MIESIPQLRYPNRKQIADDIGITLDELEILEKLYYLLPTNIQFNYLENRTEEGIYQIEPGFTVKNGHVKGLSLNDIGLKKIPTIICEMDHLDEVILRGNKLEKLPALPNTVNIIDLSQNYFRYFPRCRKKTKKIQYLNLDCNMISWIPRWFNQAYTQLEYLSIAYNAFDTHKLNGLQRLVYHPTLKELIIEDPWKTVLEQRKTERCDLILSYPQE